MLYQESRPKNLDEIVGNKGVVESLKGIIKDSDRPHTFLFHGESGSGKTTCARILAKEFGANDDSIQEINAANVTGIDNIRKIDEHSNYKPMFADVRVIIFDECHKLSSASQNCLLKILEDMPEYQYYILCSTEPNKIIKTIRNRCTTFKTNLLDLDELKEVVLTSWNRLYEDELDEKCISYAIRNADGSPRKALVNIEKLISCDKDSLKDILDKIEESEEDAFRMAQMLVKNDWKGLVKKLNNLTVEPESCRMIMANYLASCIRNKTMNKDIERFILALSVFTDSYSLQSNEKAKLTRMIGEAYLHLNGK